MLIPLWSRRMSRAARRLSLLSLLTSLTRPGYTFAGWSIIPDAEVAYNPDSVVEVEAGAEMILYAVWVKNVKLEITHDGNAPDAANVPAADVKWVAPGESYTFTIANGPTRPGYRFVEWNTADNGTGDSIKPGQTTLLHAGETGYSKTYYAKWEPEEVTLLTGASWHFQVRLSHRPCEAGHDPYLYHHCHQQYRR